MKTRFMLFALFGLIQACPSQDIDLPFDVTIAEDPSFYSQGIRTALTSIHDKNDFVYEYLKTDCKLSDEEAVSALKQLVDELAGKDSPEDRSDRFQAICCISDYPSDAAVSVLESIVLDKSEIERRAAASALTKLALQDQSVLCRLKRIMDDIPAGGWERQTVYQTVSAKLQYGGPSADRQLLLAHFLLERSVVETVAFDMLDEILCREVPKWRASPQRAENAAKMVREHPDDARLVSFFENVRTNALQAAGVAFADGPGAVPPPAADNRGSSSGTNAEVDPWAGLLDDLPEKKPWVRPSGSEPLVHSSSDDPSPSDSPPPAPKPAFQAMPIFSSEPEEEPAPSAPKSEPAAVPSVSGGPSEP